MKNLMSDIQHYIQNRKTYRKELLIKALQSRGNINILIGFYDRALNDYQRICQFKEYRVNGYIGISEVLEYMGKYRDALEHINRALKETTTSLSRIEVMNQKLFLLIRLGYINRVKIVSKSVQKFIKGIKAKKQEIYISIARSFYNLAVFYFQTGKFNIALQFAKRCVKIAGQIEDKRRQGLSYNLLGLIYKKLNKRNFSLNYFQKSAQYFNQIGDVGQLAGCYNNIGNSMEDLSEAISYYKKALSIFIQIGYTMGIVEVTHNIANSNLSLGISKTALAGYKKAYEISKTMEYKFGISINLTGMGRASKLLGNYKQARKYFYKAFNLTSEINDREGLLENSFIIAVLKNEQNDNTAYFWIQKAKQLAKELKNYPYLAEILYEEFKYLIYYRKYTNILGLKNEVSRLSKLQLTQRAQIFLIILKLEIQNTDLKIAKNRQVKILVKEAENLLKETQDCETIFYLSKTLINFYLDRNLKKAYLIHAFMNRMIGKDEMKCYYPTLLFLKVKLDYYKSGIMNNNKIKQALNCAKTIGNRGLVEEINRWSKLKKSCIQN